MRKIFLLLIFFLTGMFAKAQQDTTRVPLRDTANLSDLSIEELSKLKSRYTSTSIEKLLNQAIAAASRKPLSLKKSPSIVAVVTADEIEKSGARDIMDVLRLVPGIDFNVDVEGVTGISMRGLWANEGKVLLLLDNQEMNENAFGTLQLGNNFNISQVKRVEVIRGPGSAIYGGFAEYAVINIITKSGEDLNGININGIIGQTADTYARRNLSIAAGKKINDFSFSASGFLGKGQRSNSDYADVYGNTYNMAGNSKINPANINIGMAYKDLSVRFVYDALSTETRDGFINVLQKACAINFTNYLAEVKYAKTISKKLEVQTRFNYTHTIPWKIDIGGYVDRFYYTIITNRLRLNTFVVYEPVYWLNITAGMEAFHDDASKPEGQIFTNDNSRYVNYFNYAPYVQALFKTRFANITVGSRYDYNSAYGGAFNPRLGITKKTGLFNFKLLYAASFRAPSIENIQLALDNTIKPEQSQTLELEASCQLNRNMYFSVNIFDIATKNYIRYLVTEDSITGRITEGYTNYLVNTGSQGLEAEYRYKSSFGFINLSYAYYTLGNKNADKSNAVNINRNASLGIANHKLTLLASINAGKYFYVSPSVNFLGRRYGYTAVDDAGDGVIGVYKPQAQINLYAGCKDMVKGFSFGAGIYNLSDESISYIQPYNGLHGAYPGMGREFVLKMSYAIPFTSEKNK